MDIFVNKNRLDISDRNTLNIRLNNVINSVTTINNKQSEYSFSFNIPTTPHNNIVFNNANELSVNNKFDKIFDCEVYSDEYLIFSGQLKIASIEATYYTVNLVNIKLNTVDSIFNDDTLDKLDWKIDFNGISTINNLNKIGDKVMFPLVNYGAFQKKPLSTDYGYNTYSDYFLIDDTNQWFYSSFSPSLNLVELIKRLFKQYGYELSGNILTDSKINSLYCSTNLADGQIPSYNIGNPLLGKVQIKSHYSNFINNAVDSYLIHNLQYPTEAFTNMDSYTGSYLEYNWEDINIYDLWVNSTKEVTQSYLFGKDDNTLVIPQSGLYKIQLDCTIQLDEQSLQGNWKTNGGDTTIDLINSLQRDMPIEVQLVRNTDEDIELIKGDSNPTYLKGDRTLYQNNIGCYPNERPYQSQIAAPYTARFLSVDRTTRNSIHRGTTGHRTSGDRFYGYMPLTKRVLCVDSSVNPNFICGVSSLSTGINGVIKNGYGWNNGEENKSYYNVQYYAVTKNGDSIDYKEVPFNQSPLKDAPEDTIKWTGVRKLESSIHCIVWLEKDDILSLKAIQKNWTNSSNNVIYKFSVDSTLDIEAYNPSNSVDSWNSSSKFDTQLKLGNFLNNSTTIASFINNFIKEFNLSYQEVNNKVILNTQKLVNSRDVVDLDIRDYKIDSIDYPKAFIINYNINTDEYGFELTVPKDKLNESNWSDYGNSHQYKINLGGNDDSTIDLIDSWCYFTEFKLFNDSNVISIPIIQKSEYIYGDYEELMKNDGKSLPIRYWAKPIELEEYQLNCVGGEKYNVFVPKQTDINLIKDYFNWTKFHNYVTIEYPLNTRDYFRILNGAYVRFDKDLYKVAELQGFGADTTEIKLLNGN